MSPWPRVFITALTHGLALAAGWWVCEEALNPLPTDSTQASTKAGNREPGPEKSGDAVLAAAVKSQGPGGVLPGNTHRIDLQEATGLELTFFVRPPDYEAAMAEELVAWAPGTDSDVPPSAKVVALMLHWLLDDPEAFFTWADAGNDPVQYAAMGAHLSTALEMLLREGGASALIGIAGMDRRWGNLAGRYLGTELAKSADLAAIADARAQLSADGWASVQRSLAVHWPGADKDGILQLAIDADSPAMILEFSSKLIEPPAEWLLGLIEKPALTEEFREALAKNPEIRKMISSDTSMALEQRLMPLGELPRDQGLARLSQQEAHQLLREPRDWTFAFRHGEASAAEVYQAVAAGMPELAAVSPAAIRDEVFKQLAGADPARAMELLEDLPDEEQHAKLLFAARTGFSEASPDILYHALQAIPADTPELWNQRLDVWDLRAWTNHQKLNEDFVDWVRELPAGLDREMALYSTARAVQDTDLGLALQLRAEVTDPKLQQRIAENR